VFCEPNQPNHGVPNAEVEKGKSSSPTSGQLQTKNSGNSQGDYRRIVVVNLRRVRFYNLIYCLSCESGNVEK